jgi:hypothetical protein
MRSAGAGRDPELRVEGAGECPPERAGGVLCLSHFRALAKRASPGGTREQRWASTATQTLSGASHPAGARARRRM